MRRFPRPERGVETFSSLQKSQQPGRFIYIYIYIYSEREQIMYTPRPRGRRKDPRPLCALGIRPILLLTLRIPRLLDSTFPGNSLWAWEFHPLELTLCLSQTSEIHNVSTEIGRTHREESRVGRCCGAPCTQGEFQPTERRTCSSRIPQLWFLGHVVARRCCNQRKMSDVLHAR